MIRIFTALLISAFVIAGCTPTPTTGVGGVKIISRAETDALIARHVDTVNAFRAERGLRPVQVSAQLIAAARTHARDMSVQKRAWHFGSDGSSPKDRAERAGYTGFVLGENISESYDSEFELMQSWLRDPVTSRVMSNPRATEIGLGWFQEPSGKLWWVQMMGQGRTSNLIGG